MSSILTNASALTALQNLANTQKALSTTQEQISTGLSVGSAKDNGAYWSIAQTMNSDNGALGAVSSSLKTTSAMLSNFTSGLKAAISVVNKIKADLVLAEDPTQDLNKIQEDIKAQQNSLIQIANGATFNEQNWMNGTVTGTANASVSSTITLVGGYTNDGGVQTISTEGSDINLFIGVASDIASATGGILGGTPTAGGTGSVLGTGAFDVTASSVQSQIQDMLTSINNTISLLETAASSVGSAETQVSTQSTFVATMQSNLSNGISALVDADMNQVSTRLQALQTQQQLGVQSLSIANQSSQMILKLFQ